MRTSTLLLLNDEGGFMKAVACLAAILTLGLAAGAYAQPMPPQPGPEHEILKRDVGTWDATIEMSFPGAPPMTMTGVEKSALVAGRWLVTEWESDMMGETFEGRGIAGWDPGKKAYVGVWADSMNSEFSHSESTYDAEKDALVGWMEMPDPMGGMTKAKTVEEWPDEETRVIKIYPDESGEPFMTMTYKRRK
jgi:hypothetical protein